jgi:hypothetical protein
MSPVKAVIARMVGYEAVSSATAFTFLKDGTAIYVSWPSLLVNPCGALRLWSLKKKDSVFRVKQTFNT